MVKINNNITEEPCQLYDPDGNLVGTIENVLAFYDVRVQIKEMGLSGYYIMFKGQRITIDRNGTLKNHPNGLFDLNVNQLFKLV